MDAIQQQILPDPLTERELDILGRIASGLSNREIGQALFITVDTVKWYNKQIYSKLGVNSRTQAVARAQILGVLDGASEPASTDLRRRTMNITIPIQLTPFIGRARERTEIKDLLGSARLLSLTGPGGTGKTRLSIQVASELTHTYRDGTNFVRLAALRDSAQVPNAIAEVLHLHEQSGNTLSDTLKTYLRGKQMLLVLDNFEHIMDGAPYVSELLNAAPDLQIMVTSREVLHLYGEQEYPVPPMTLPESDSNLADITRNEAVALFVQSAQAVNPNFEISQDLAPIIVDICQRLDGLPLAIELAAARIKVLSPQDILERLSERLATLTGGSRDLPQRQQTLRNTIDWSYNLLNEFEQELFACLAVFRGGWTLDGAEALCVSFGGVSGLDGLQSLVDKNLVAQRHQFDGQTRFYMLETIREYAKERLAALHDEAEVRQAHANYFRDLAERAEPMVRGYDHDLWFPRLMDEHDNFRSALGWSFGDGDLETGMRLVAALGLFWYLEGRHHIAARRWTQRAQEHIDEVPPEVAAAVNLSIAYLYWTEGEWPMSNTYYSRAMEIYEQLGDRRNYAWARSLTAVAYINLPDDYEQAVAICQECLAIAREFDDKAGQAWTYNIMGELTRVHGDYARAREYYETVLALCRETGNRWRAIMQYFNLGAIAYHDGNYALAKQYFEENLNLAIDTHNTVQIGDGILGLAGVEVMTGDPHIAVKMAGAGQAICDMIDHTHQTADALEFERYLAKMHELVDDETFAKMWDEGYALPLHDAIALALGDTID
jgi:predicted ATPase/DNA-binding CsgD family transcriptional regulator